MFRVRRNAASGSHLSGTLAIALALTLAVNSRAADLTPAAAGAFFADNCSACHTIGEGDGVGPDLLPATKYPEAQLQEAVVRMEMHIGPIDHETVEGLVRLLRDPSAKSLIAGTAAPPAPAPVKAPPAGSPQRGRQLFFGAAPLANGGTPCFACHAAEGRGGNLAIDLTGSHARLGDKGVATVTERPPFPMMKAAYLGHAVTAGEAVDLTAFLREAGGVAARGETSGLVHAVAAALTLVTLAALAFIFRTRRGSVRARRLRDSSEGERS